MLPTVMVNQDWLNKVLIFLLWSFCYWHNWMILITCERLEQRHQYGGLAAQELQMRKELWSKMLATGKETNDWVEATLGTNSGLFEWNIQIFLPRSSMKPGKCKWDSQVSLWQWIQSIPMTHPDSGLILISPKASKKVSHRSLCVEVEILFKSIIS